ncbi:MAG TPA: hypothetical protein VF533_11290 [Solirubrobacteraceae bacterium]
MWNVNSTPRGVAEMLLPLLAYARGIGVDARWEAIRGDERFFTITKRIHNRLHGAPGDGGPLVEAERAAYDATLAPNAEALRARRPSGARRRTGCGPTSSEPAPCSTTSTCCARWRAEGAAGARAGVRAIIRRSRGCSSVG